MIEKIFDIIKYDSENALLDFKQNEYPLGKHAKKNELLKDVSAMANHPSNDPKYIIIGVKERNGLAAEFFNIKAPTDQAKYQQFIEENIEPKLNFEYKTFNYEGYNLAVFIISKNDSRPYLLKKNAYRSTDNAIEFKIGDGFIRTGSSIRKLTRDDLEVIYTNKFEKKDRSTDIKVIPIFKESNNWPGYYNLDFSIENLSSKSIEFNVEFRVLRSKDAILIKTFDLEKRSNEKGLTAIYPQYFSPKIDETFQLIEIDKQKSYYKVLRLQRLTLSQKDTIEKVFINDILVGFIGHLQRCTIIVELILRSDDFKNGPFTQKYEFNLKN